MKAKKILLACLTVLLAALVAFAVSAERILPRRDSGESEPEQVSGAPAEQTIPPSGWQMSDGKRYYYDPDGGGVKHTGWLTLEEGTYYLDAEGVMQTGWLDLEQGTYYLDSSGLMATGWLDSDGDTYYLDETGTMTIGWLELDGSRYYLDETGVMQTGWAELEDGRYYLDETGAMVTGWLEQDGRTYYLTEDGTPAVGGLEIDGRIYYFTSRGENIVLVNRWNEVPQDYEVELKQLPNGRYIAAECYDALLQMVDDCTATGCHPEIIGANRTNADQRSMFNSKLKAYQDDGLSYGTAYAKTMEAVAVPGTSEHELGLAVDILDKYYPKQYTGDDNCMVWLNEHCWEYGFIVRYPDAKKNITGIKFEPWHYRYVGVELAMELKDSGLCLEEYLDQLTGDGTTCGNPEK